MQSRILIVEDNDSWREILGLFLRDSGYEVFEAATGPAAIDQASAVNPDLILMDIGLPGLSGDEATARIKTNPATSDIPVVIQTAYVTPMCTRRALSAGASEVLHKPIDFDTISRTVRKYLGLRRPVTAGALSAVE